MALQDLCRSRSQDFLLDSTEFFSGSVWGNMTSGSPLLCSANFFHFYTPAPEYLGQSPIEFGQVRESRAAIVPADLFCSLPATILVAAAATSQSVPPPFPMSHGTTTLAFMFQGGVLAAADTRSSCAGLVECPSAQKVVPIHSHLVGTTSGTSADCALWKRILARELRLYQLRYGRRLSTAGAAKLLSHMLHPFKGTELCVAATLCGWDVGRGEGEEQSARSNGNSCGPSLYYVCSDGTRLQGSLFSVGSGSPYAYSILDQGVHWGLTVEEATAVAREAVYRATHRDAYSGNNVDVYLVSSGGWARRQREDLKEEYYRERARRERQQQAVLTCVTSPESRLGNK